MKESVLKSGVQVLDRTCDILECLAEHGTELGLSEITDDLGLSKSTVHRLLSALERRAYVRRFPLTSKYGLGTKLVELGFKATNGALELVIVKQTPDDPTTSAVETRPALSWTALSLSVDALAVLGLPSSLNISASDLMVKLNLAAADSTKLDWTSMALVAGMEVATIDAGLGVEFAGAIDLQVSGVVLLSGAFKGSIRTDDITDGTITIGGAQVLRLEITDVFLFAGVDGAFETDSDGKVIGIEDQGIGFAASGAALDLMIVKQTPDDPTTAAVETRLPLSWIALAASADEIAPRGLPSGLTIVLSDLAVSFNLRYKPRIDNRRRCLLKLGLSREAEGQHCHRDRHNHDGHQILSH